MSLQLVRIVLFLPFLSIVSAGTHPSTSSPSFSVIQTPLFLNVSEGSDVTLNCNMEGNVSSKWFVTWMKMGEKDNIKNSKRIFVTTHKINKSSILTLKSTVIDDSGIYQCEFGDSGHSQLRNTSVTIWEKPNVVVSQTPQQVSRKVGGNVTITCNFSRVDNPSLMEVKWYKDKQELRNPKHTEKSKQKAFLKLVNVNLEDSGNYVCTIRIRNRTGSGNGTWVNITAAKLLVIQSPPSIQATEGENLTMDCRVQGNETKHLHNVSWYKTASDGQKTLMTHGTDVLIDRASLFLQNIKKEDSGNYTCEVDRYGQGKGTRVTILGHEKNIKVHGDNRKPGSPQENTGGEIVIPLGVGVAVGTLVFLLLLGAVVWRSKRKNKGASENPSEVEPAASKEARKHASLTKQVSEVTYADIRFHKREVPPDAEVVYAEVKMDAKRPEHRDRGTQPAGLH
ncbi:tyrosine-protein kinase-like otk isoform 2-T2 [Vipera latastei]